MPGYLTVLASSFLLGALAPQEVSLFESWRWVRHTTSAGLPSDIVNDVTEAADGSTWALTQRGPARYDGRRWNGVAGLEKPAPRFVDSGPGKQVLVAIGGTLFRGEAGGFEPVELTHDGRPVEVLGAAALGADSLLVRTPQGLLRRDATGLEPFPLPEDVPAGWKGALRASRGGTPWLDAKTGTYAWSDGEWIRVHDRRAAFLEGDDAGGIVTFTDQAGIWIYEGRLGSPLVLAEGELVAVTAIDALDQRNVIALLETGELRLREGDRWRGLPEIPAEFEDANFIRCDDDGDWWVGEGARGLSVYRGSSERWSDRSVASDVLRYQIGSMLSTPEGDLWIGSGAGVELQRADGERRSWVEIEGRPLGPVTGLARDANGDIWLSSGSGLDGVIRRRGSTWRHFGKEDGLLASHVHAIELDRGGRLWFLGMSDRFGLDEPGAFVYDGERFERWGEPEGLPSGRVYAFAEGTDGALWFATLGGISRWSAGAWTHWNETDGLAADRVYTLDCTPDGRVWFGHQNGQHGLGTLDEEGRVRYLGPDEGLVHGSVVRVRADPSGALWIGTRGGLARYADGRFSAIDREDGLEFANVTTILPERDRVLVGSLGGRVQALDLAELSNPAPAVVVHSTVTGPRNVHLTWTAHAFEGELAPERIRTRYQLDDAPWSPWSLGREAVLLDAAPGEHSFRVQAMSLLGNVDRAGGRAVFRIPRPLYQQPIVLGTAALWFAGVAAGAWFAVRRRRHHRRLLEASEARHRTLVEEISVCIHELDLDGRILSINPAGLRMIGAAEQSAVVGADYFALIVPEDRERLRELFARACQGHGAAFEFEAVFQGERRAVESNFAPIFEDGAVVKVIGVSSDVTERRLAESQQRDLEERLRVAQKLEAVGLLAGGVAHDFNNLLTVIGGHASLLESDSDDRLVRESAAEIVAAHDRATQLTRQLLAVGRRQVLQPRVVDLGRVVQAMTEFLGPLLGAGIELRQELSTRDCCAVADPSQLEQVIMNLALNARDAMPDGGRLTLSTDVHEQAAARPELPAGRYATLRVADTGVGMSPETRARVFEPFFTTKSREKGTGLGLSTVYGIVEQTGGFIEVQSRPGVGTTIAVYLPWTGEPLAPSDPGIEREAGRGGSETVLVAEDDPAILRLVGRSLRGQGYTVLEAEDGLAAIAVLDRHPGRVELLLTDVAMPRMNGRDLALEYSRRVPDGCVLFMTGYEGDTLAADPSWSPENLIRKPASQASIVRKVREALDARSRRMEPT